jgi:hypothetical protein
MISMKLTPEEAKQESHCVPCDDSPAYPYGLSLSLDDKSLEKLGITALPAVGSKMVLRALVEVSSTSQHENQKDKDISVSLQITDMDIEPSRDATALYPNSNMS